MLQLKRPNRTAIVGTFAIGAAISVSSVSVVQAGHVKPDNKVYSCKNSTTCLTATSTKATAFSGMTNASNGDAAINGDNTGTFGAGVQGSSSGGSGGLFFSSLAGSEAVKAVSAVGYGSWSESSANGNFAASYARASDKATSIFYGENTQNASGSGGNAHCKIDNNANLNCTGTITGIVVNERHSNLAGQRVLTYAAESTSASLEDVGTGHMVGGTASIALDRAFGSLIDRNHYHVFVTPEGDAALYVAQKTPSGFVIRETHGGRSMLDFEYRIVSRPLDAANTRLPEAPAEPERR